MFPVTTGSMITVEAGTEASKVSVGSVMGMGVGVGVGAPARATPLSNHEKARASTAPCQVVRLIFISFIAIPFLTTDYGQTTIQQNGRYVPRSWTRLALFQL